ncbi:MAG: cupin [Candidatus Entotheonella gemina]|uniref:Cupin n=1 Tax=Candidatus Entotheonella gemina TaxID=1429439 RepID=W4MEL1_9BACT|nr:MAG: cupin [Candidatus Entotheonella gemina]
MAASSIAPEPSWSLRDRLGEVLHHLRMSGMFYCRSELSEPWGIDLPPLTGCLMFHVVTSGHCWLEINGFAPCLLQPGEFALVPHGHGHRIMSELGAPLAKLFDLDREEVSDCYELLRHGGGGTPATMVCGAVRFEHPAAQRLVRLLPSLLHVQAWNTIEEDWVRSTLSLMAAEAKHLRPGGEAVITRLSDILVIQTLRWWLAHHGSTQEGWLGALQDDRIGQAMTLIHRDPECGWNVASLAAAVAMSRSAFAAQFTQLVGESPMRYVTRWRMQLAWSWLREDKQTSIGDLAARLGYQSEAAFSRAFQRYMGVAPGAARKLQEETSA